jgi:hypothetical protein
MLMLGLLTAVIAAAVSREQIGAAPEGSDSQSVGVHEACTAENTPAAAPPRSPPPFRFFRYDEDYSRVADPAQRGDFFDPIRFMKLNDAGDWRLTLGGEARTRYEYFSEPGFGLRGLDHDDFIAKRLLLHADLRAGERFRAFAQVLSGYQIGNESPTSPTQDNVLDLQQAFVDLAIVKQQDLSLTLRGGRQEMGFGSYRLVTPRDATNARLTFDGARLTLKAAPTTIDAFITRPVQQKRDIFNDSPDQNQAFWGLYSTTPIAADSRANIDLYYLGLDRAISRYAAGIADETRHSLGARLWGTPGNWDYDFEGVLQFGTWGDKDIRAWTLASNTGYTFKDEPWKPRLGLKANIASGDRDPADGHLGTFNALFPRNNYFNDANLFTPANFFDLHPSVQVSPIDTLTLTAAADFFFRYSTDDAVYAPGRIGIPAGAGGERFVGTAVTLQADWTISRNLSWTLACTHFFRGPVVTDAGGKDVNFVGIWLTFRF